MPPYAATPPIPMGTHPSLQQRQVYLPKDALIHSLLLLAVSLHPCFFRLSFLGSKSPPSLPHPSHGTLLVPHPVPRHISRPTHNCPKPRGTNPKLGQSCQEQAGGQTPTIQSLWDDAHRPSHTFKRGLSPSSKHPGR